MNRDFGDSSFRLQQSSLAPAGWISIDSGRCAAPEALTQSSMSVPYPSPPRTAAAGVVAGALVGGDLLWQLFREGVRYQTGIGEISSITLDDGSTMQLNTATSVRVRFTKRRRDIELIRGEAFFEVSPDKARPFFVSASNVTARAVGTAFVVRLLASQVDVTVTEGIVEVAPQAASAVRAATLSRRAEPERVIANERVVISSSHPPQVQLIAPTEAQRQLAWREGLVSFDGESLQAAVAEINRYNRRQIVVEDPYLAAKPVVGVFRASDLDGFAAAAAAALKATVISNGEIIRLLPVQARHRRLAP